MNICLFLDQSYDDYVQRDAQWIQVWRHLHRDVECHLSTGVLPSHPRRYGPLGQFASSHYPRSHRQDSVNIHWFIVVGS